MSDHEPFDDAMKRESIIRSSTHVVQELRDRTRCRIPIQLKYDGAHRGIELDVMKA